VSDWGEAGAKCQHVGVVFTGRVLLEERCNEKLRVVKLEFRNIYGNGI
jgi:hypothetical protein